MINGIEHTKCFDTASAIASQRMQEFVMNLPPNRLVVLAVDGDGSHCPPDVLCRLGGGKTESNLEEDHNLDDNAAGQLITTDEGVQMRVPGYAEAYILVGYSGRPGVADGGAYNRQVV